MINIMNKNYYCSPLLSTLYFTVLVLYLDSIITTTFAETPNEVVVRHINVLMDHQAHEINGNLHFISEMINTHIIQNQPDLKPLKIPIHEQTTHNIHPKLAFQVTDVFYLNETYISNFNMANFHCLNFACTHPAGSFDFDIKNDFIVVKALLQVRPECFADRIVYLMIDNAHMGVKGIGASFDFGFTRTDVNIETIATTENGEDEEFLLEGNSIRIMKIEQLNNQRCGACNCIPAMNSLFIRKIVNSVNKGLQEHMPVH
eukprot:Pgem_evm1s2781